MAIMSSVYNSLDYYPTTDKKAVELFLEREREKFERGVWESCCGEGILTNTIAPFVCSIAQTGISRYGDVGESLNCAEQNFFTFPLKINSIPSTTGGLKSENLLLYKDVF